MSESSLLDLIKSNTDNVIDFPRDFSIVELLERHERADGAALAFRFLDFSGFEDKVHTLTWTQFITRVKAVAARIQQVSARGDRAAVLCRQGLDYVVAFFGAIFAGNIAVPLFEPSEIGHTDRLNAVIADCNPTVLLTSSATAEEVRVFFRNRPAKERPRVLAVDAVPDDVGMLWWRPESDLKSTAYLQYTSGSTRIPSGVEITHENISTNCLQIGVILEVDDNGAGCSWLPLFHDMGLISMMVPILGGGSTTLMSPSAFVRRPARWMQALSDVTKDEHINHSWSAAPNFAYEHAALRGLPKPDQELNLSKVVLLNGSEPISISSMRKFNTAFEPYGITDYNMKPCYGLAEATLMVSCTRMRNSAKILYVNRQELSHGKFVPVSVDHEKAIPQVSCGQVTRFQNVVIVDPESQVEKADGEIGEIWCHGQNIGRGYWQKPEETEKTFRAQVAQPLAVGSHMAVPEDSYWMRTGDLGTYVDGELYVTGRIKDLIIIDGRNHYPQDIEYSAQEASDMLRKGYVAAFTVSANELARIAQERGETMSFEASDDDISEQLVIVGERASGVGKFDFEAAKDAVRMAVAARHGITVRDLILVTAGRIPRTSSGKIAHAVCKAEYLDGILIAHSKNK